VGASFPFSSSSSSSSSSPVFGSVSVVAGGVGPPFRLPTLLRPLLPLFGLWQLLKLGELCQLSSELSSEL
jgi:hypothetical protein